MISLIGGGISCLAVDSRRAWIGYWWPQGKGRGEERGEKLLLCLLPLHLLQLLHNAWLASCTHSRVLMVSLEVRLYAVSASSVQVVESARGNRNQSEGACTFGPQCTSAQCAKAIGAGRFQSRGDAFLNNNNPNL